MPRAAVAYLAGVSVAALALLPAAAHGAWAEPVAGPSPLNASSTEDAQAGGSLTTIAGSPWAAWPEFASGHTQVRVAYLNDAGTAWVRPGAAANPINLSPSQDASSPSLADVGGVPHVAWAEFDGTNNEVRVSRLNAAGTDWEEAVGGASPVNRANNLPARHPSLTSVGGVPYVAWSEDDGSNTEIRVSRFNAAASDWQEVVGANPNSPINASPTSDAEDPDIATVGNVPYVVWSETDGSAFQIRVSRLDGAGTGWQPVGGSLNHDAARNGFDPRIASIAGVPYVTWVENDGINAEIRVSRLNSAGTGWEEVVGGDSPVNNEDDRPASGPRITSVGGVPYVAWRENGPQGQVRVTRLNADGTAWEQVVGGASPVNIDGAQNGTVFGITGVGGVPHVGWVEDDGANIEARVKRLEPELTAPQSVPTSSGAVLLTRARTFGVRFPVAFAYGPGGSLTSRTPVVSSDGVSTIDTVHATVGGLKPSTVYSQRPVAFDGKRSFAAGAVSGFTTTAAPAPRRDEVRVEVTRLLVAIVNQRLRVKAGRRVKLTYLSTTPGRATLEVRKGSRRIARVTKPAKAGRNTITWNGRRGRKKATRGRYSLRLSVTGGDSQTASDSARLTLRR